MIKRQKWQTGDNAFNEMSGAVHERANSTLHEIKCSLSTRISWKYARILCVSLLLMLLLTGTTYIVQIYPHIAQVREYMVSQLTPFAREYAANANRKYSPTLVELAQYIPLPDVPPRPESTPAASPALPSFADPLTQGDSQPPLTSGTTLVPALEAPVYAMLTSANADIIYDDIPQQLTGAGAAFQWYGNSMIYREFFSVDVDGAQYEISLCYDVQYALHMLLGILAAIAAFDILRALYFVLRSKSINADVLLPIVEMSETARHLSGSNMSERINVEGTKSELRELALTINDMLDRLEDAYNSQKQFVSDASHELRTPIAVIQGYANLLNRWGKDSEDVRDESISAIIKEAENMKELVEKLLFLARHDKKTLKLNMEEFDVREMVADMIRETEMIDRTHKIQCGELAHAHIVGDAISIKQCIRIFIDNACKYTPEGGVITISCKRAGLGCMISVADTGRGIPKDQLRKVFERFYRLDDVRASVTGHGLGLAIARIIAISHKGKIHVTSRHGEGSTFTLEVPGMR